MSQNRRNTFLARSSIFASPADSSIVRNTKRARENPLQAIPFINESKNISPEKENNQVTCEASIQIIDAQPKLPSKNSQQVAVDFENEVEPMEVDTTIVPSPPKHSLPQGNVQYTVAATPRRKSVRKSMPTPGKRLCFTSKETENEQRKTNETTQLELFMANNPEEMSSNMRNMINDRKEMSEYAAILKREIEELEEIKRFRQKLFENAMETTSHSFISSVVPIQIQALNFSIRRIETPVEMVTRLHGIFLSKTAEAGQQRVALKKAQTEEENNHILKVHLNCLEEAKKKKKEYDSELCKLYKQEYDALNKFNKKIDSLDYLMKKFRSVPMIF